MAEQAGSTGATRVLEKARKRTGGWGLGFDLGSVEERLALWWMEAGAGTRDPEVFGKATAVTHMGQWRELLTVFVILLGLVFIFWFVLFS